MASATGNIVVIERDSLDYMEKEQIQFDDSEYYNMRVNKPQTLRFDRSKMGRLFEEIFFAGFLPMIVYFSSLFFLSTSLLRRNIPNAGTWIARILAVLVAVALVLWPAGSLKKSTWDIRKTKVMEWKAVTFLWYQLLCFLVVGIFSIVYADTMYTEYVMPYQNYLDKKWIEQPISPLLQSGQNFQDAGVVSFSADSYIDRAHNACFRGAGVSYCVVPIVQDTAGTGDRTRLPSSPTGSYDYFAVGTDCCSCPGTGDFQCGDWDFSESMGIKCKNVWVWKIARFVMLVWDDQKVCDACPRREPFVCHAKTQFVMRKTQYNELQTFLMLGWALQSTHYSQRSITSFQTQTDICAFDNGRTSATRNGAASVLPAGGRAVGSRVEQRLEDALVLPLEEQALRPNEVPSRRLQHEHLHDHAHTAGGFAVCSLRAEPDPEHDLRKL
ncbi:unnamed protein product [Amoebophrya sp. A120]|nr:unnamed protein product [Amoebophrya sp. A120]|eukprot:GSA120T00011480001.1